MSILEFSRPLKRTESKSLNCHVYRINDRYLKAARVEGSSFHAVRKAIRQPFRGIVSWHAKGGEIAPSPTRQSKYFAVYSSLKQLSVENSGFVKEATEKDIRPRYHELLQRKHLGEIKKDEVIELINLRVRLRQIVDEKRKSDGTKDLLNGFAERLSALRELTATLRQASIAE